ncbi:hypothetical protein [Xanthobacter sp. YC-JY1]|jgi:hypothetical protein|uniref:hypothetical protein n=1 Tax=Xanthobacter sp. YC-JY1 TaxID=2419844 RepID=UPI001F3DD550|nr:hypothetical protein [Xanthobacter sp. YC-JY1]UJX45748.1 hypothetical protein D7006_14235 [Xanthobacter sp. YC-JY1]
MSTKATLSLLEQLHGLLAQEFIDRIRDGKATSGDLAAAVRLLKDNGVDARASDAGELEDRLAGLLPFQPEPPDPDIID